jgi:hypothetical protein
VYIGDNCDCCRLFHANIVGFFLARISDGIDEVMREGAARGLESLRYSRSEGRRCTFFWYITRRSEI